MNTSKLILSLFICAAIFSCDPDDDNGPILTFKGKIENPNGDVYADSKIYIERFQGGNGRLIDSTETDSNGEYFIELNNEGRELYILSTPDTLTHFFDEESDPLSFRPPVYEIWGKDIQTENDWDIRFCSENKLMIDIIKTSGQNVKCSLGLDPFSHDHPAINRYTPGEFLIQEDTFLVIKTICKIENYKILWRILDENDQQISKDSVFLPISQIESNYFEIEY